MYLIFLASRGDCGVIWETADSVSVIRRGVHLNPLRFLPPDGTLHEWMTTGLFDASFHTRSLNLSSSPPDSTRGLPTAPRAHALPPWAQCPSAPSLAAPVPSRRSQRDLEHLPADSAPDAGVWPPQAWGRGRPRGWKEPTHT